MAARIKKGDKVVVVAGKDKGRQGEVLRVDTDSGRIAVQGVAMIKRHTKQTPRSPGGIITREGTIHASNVAHLDPASGKPTRVGFKFLEDGRKVRFAKRSGEVIDR